MRKIRKFMTIALTAAMLAAVWGGNAGFAGPMTVHAVQNVTGVKYTDVRGIVWTYDIKDDVVYITGVNKDSVNSFDGVIYVPDPGTFASTMGLPVVVRAGAFGSALSGMTTVSIPEGIVLEEGAFNACPDLETVIPEGWLESDAAAFVNCPKLTVKPPVATAAGKDGWMCYSSGRPSGTENVYEKIGSFYSSETGKRVDQYKAKFIYLYDADSVIPYQIGENKVLTKLHGSFETEIFDMTGSRVTQSYDRINHKREIFYMRPGTKGSALRSITFEEGIEEVYSPIYLDDRCRSSLDIYVPQSCKEFWPQFVSIDSREKTFTVRVHGVPGGAGEAFCKDPYNYEHTGLYNDVFWNCGYGITVTFVPDGGTNPNINSSDSDESVAAVEFGWSTGQNTGKQYWFEGGVRQGTYDDPNGVIGDGTVRGREIYDPSTKGWYWLDAVYNGAKACSKEVWMPYIYQKEKKWDDAEIAMNAKNSGDMAAQVTEAIKNGSGKWVRYDAQGKMIKGWYKVEGDETLLYPKQAGNIYYYDQMTGLMAKGTVTIEGKTYHFNEITGALIE